MIPGKHQLSRVTHLFPFQESVTSGRNISFPIVVIGDTSTKEEALAAEPFQIYKLDEFNHVELIQTIERKPKIETILGEPVQNPIETALTQALSVGDFNGDGITDILFSAFNPNEIAGAAISSGGRVWAFAGVPQQTSELRKNIWGQFK